MKRSILGVLPLSLLTACGPGPSESAMNKAMEQSMLDTSKQVESFSGEELAERFTEPTPALKKIGCKDDGENAFVCDVELTVADRKAIAPLRFVKTSDGWRISGRAPM